MLFNTPDFVIFFIFVVTVFILARDRKFQHIFLLAASYFFFYYSSNYLITLLIFTTVWDYYLGKKVFAAPDRQKKKLLLAVSFAGNLGLLGFFKYYDFAVTQFNILGQYFDLSATFPVLNLALPIGISFYTFHSIGYIVDIYRGDVRPAKSLKEYAIFISFFPQLVAGPILRSSQFLPQLGERVVQVGEAGNRAVSVLRQIVIQKENLKFGVTLMMFGFFKKMFLADNIAPMVNEIFANPVGSDSFTIILGTIAFGIQIYCDFSGYSDIAIGAATVLGFKIPMNFNKPYFAASPSEFWKRWHISLSSWLRDYLYIPLGGSRKSNKRTYFNLFTVMFLGGLWHGASWNFVIWGVLHGAYLAAHKSIMNAFPSLGNSRLARSKLGIFLSIIITQYLVFLAWIPFRVKDTDGMLYSMSKYVFIDFHTAQVIQFIGSHKVPVAMMLVFLVLFLISKRRDNYAQKIANYRLVHWVPFLVGIMLLVMLFFTGNPEKFIYFQF